MRRCQDGRSSPQPPRRQIGQAQVIREGTEQSSSSPPSTSPLLRLMTINSERKASGGEGTSPCFCIGARRAAAAMGRQQGRTRGSWEKGTPFLPVLQRRCWRGSASSRDTAQRCPRWAAQPCVCALGFRENLGGAVGVVGMRGVGDRFVPLNFGCSRVCSAGGACVSCSDIHQRQAFPALPDIACWYRDAVSSHIQPTASAGISSVLSHGLL